MVDTLNSLTSQLVAGKITCGEYAERVREIQSGDASDAGESLTNPALNARAAVFDAECAHRGIPTGLDREPAGEGGEQPYCRDCHRLGYIDDLFECGDCAGLYCENCLQVVDLTDLFGNPVAVDGLCHACHSGDDE